MTINQVSTNILGGTAVTTGMTTPIVAPPNYEWIGYAVSGITGAAYIASKWYDARIKKQRIAIERRESEARIEFMGKES